MNTAVERGCVADQGDAAEERDRRAETEERNRRDGRAADRQSECDVLHDGIRVLDDHADQEAAARVHQNARPREPGVALEEALARYPRAVRA